MREPFITAVQETIDEASSKICFDRFHVASHFGKALDKVRATEHKVRKYLRGIFNAIIRKTTNAIAESVNAAVQKIKAPACGFRNRARFRIAILFHKGGLSLFPSGL